MRELYDRLLEEGETGIDRLIAENTQESLQLDFKRKEVDRNGEFSTNDRKMLAEVLSGFANSAGGVLIIGVDARKGTDGIDCAQEARPISDVRRFLADANTEVSRLVQPRLDGVSLAVITSERDPRSGYLLVCVERSDRRPHRSEAKGQKGYYKRYGDSFMEMEHYDIEDAFARQSSPSLELDYVIQQRIRSGEHKQYDIKILLRNTSEYIAKHPYLVFHEVVGCTIPRGSTSDQPINIQVGKDIISLTGGVDDVIQPYTDRHVANIRINIENRPHSGWKIAGSPNGDSVFFHVSYGCEGGRARKQRHHIDRIAFGLDP